MFLARQMFAAIEVYCLNSYLGVYCVAEGIVTNS